MIRYARSSILSSSPDTMAKKAAIGGAPAYYGMLDQGSMAQSVSPIAYGMSPAPTGKAPRKKATSTASAGNINVGGLMDQASRSSKIVDLKYFLNRAGLKATKTAKEDILTQVFSNETSIRFMLSKMLSNPALTQINPFNDNDPVLPEHRACTYGILTELGIQPSMDIDKSLIPIEFLSLCNVDDESPIQKPSKNAPIPVQTMPMLQTGNALGILAQEAVASDPTREKFVRMILTGMRDVSIGTLKNILKTIQSEALEDDNENNDEVTEPDDEEHTTPQPMVVITKRATTSRRTPKKN